MTSEPTLKSSWTRGAALALLILCASTQGLHAAAQNTPDPELRALLIKAINTTDSFEDRFDGEVWMLDMSKRLEGKLPDAKERLELLRHLHIEAKRANVPPEMVLAVIHIESNFNRWAISSAGAQGLMQVMPFWLKEIGHPKDSLFDAPTNLRLGCTILAHYLNRENGDYRKALARYNGSIGKAKYPDLVLGALRTRWFKR